MPAKKLNLALHLDPAASDSDAAALDVLQQWYAEAKQRHEDDSAAMDMAVRHFHHDVYLAGLQLHLINTQLCRQIAGQLARRSHSVELLVQQLEVSGLWAPGSSAPKDEQEAVFSSAQLEQLTQVLANAPASVEAGVVEGAAEGGTGATEFAEQDNQFAAILDELKQLRALAEQQAAELRTLRLSSKKSSAPERSTAPAAEEMNVADMAPQLAQMQKIREKGVF